ncbi:MAG: hypothetical protein ACYS1C_12530, partial [Planctomycetota bacterium]
GVAQGVQVHRPAPLVCLRNIRGRQVQEAQRVEEGADRTMPTRRGLVGGAGNVGRYTSLALDGSGHPHISYLDYGNADLKHAAWNAPSWNIEIVDSAGREGTRH